MLSWNRGRDKITLSSLEARISYLKSEKSENGKTFIKWKKWFESNDEWRCFSLHNNLLNFVG